MTKTLSEICGFTVKPVKRGRAFLTAAELAPRVGLTEERVRELADARLMPHWRIDQGPPLFVINEARRWVNDNLRERCDGAPLPTELRVVYDGEPVEKPWEIPKVLQEVGGLTDISKVAWLRAGIYFLCRGAQVVYIGQSIRVASRVGQQLAQGKEFDRAYFLGWPAFDLDRLEGAFIRLLRPPLNSLDMGVPRGEPGADREILRIVCGRSSQVIGAQTPQAPGA